MKETIPHYKNSLPLTGVFNSFSKSNQDVITSFLTDCQTSASKNTLKKIRGKIILITDVLEKNLKNITQNDLILFLGILNNSDLAIATKNDIKKNLKRLLRFQYKKDWSLKFDNFKKIKTDSKDQRKISKADLLTPSERKKIIKATDSLKYKTILLLFEETACRPEEILKNLKFKDINFETREIKLYSNKTREERSIPINKSIDHLKRYIEECFLNPPKNEDVVFDIAPAKFQGVLNKIEKKLKFPKHLYCYLYRHSILSSMIQVLSPKVYEKYSGHALETGLKIYAHLDTNDLKKELDEKVYNFKKLPEGKKHKLEKEIDNLKKIMKVLIQKGSKWDKAGKISQEQAQLLDELEKE